MTVEVQKVHGEPHHADAVVEHDEPRGAEQRSGFLNGVEACRCVELIRQHQRHGRSAGDDRFQRAIAAHPAGVVVDQLAQRRIHRRFVHARLLHMPADAIELRAAVLLGTKLRKPLRTIQQDERHVAERLDVIDRRRALIKALDGRKRRLEPRLRALSFERFDECGFFTRLIRTGATMNEHVAIESAAEDVLPEIAGRVRLLELGLEDLLHVVELAADVDVGDLRADRVAGNRAPFDQQMRVALHQHVILERAGLALVGVAADVFRLRRVLEHELPLHAGREAGAAAAAEAGGLHLLDDVIRLHRQRLAQPFVAALVLGVEVERVRVRLVDVRGQDGLIGTHFLLPAAGCPLPASFLRWQPVNAP